MKIEIAGALLLAASLPAKPLANVVGANSGEPQEAVTSNTMAAEVNMERVQKLTEGAVFAETFDFDELDGSRWFKSLHEKYANQDISLADRTLPASLPKNDRCLVLNKPARHYGLAVLLNEPLKIDESDSRKEMVVQYEVKLQIGLDCGGAYVKLLRHDEENKNLSSFSDSTPFVLMFGPDKCGQSDKVHLIFTHKNPVSGVYEEKHMMEAPRIKTDRDTHLYTAVIRDDNTFEVFVDQKSVKSGSLFENFLPSVIPEKEIDDPEDFKPDDWVNEKKIRDSSAVKPDDWDEEAPAQIRDENAVKPDDWLDNEPVLINDPDVSKPEDWVDEDDGEFVIPQISNPKCSEVSGCGEWSRPLKANPAYKGKFYAPYIPNPAYKGEWKPRKIPNSNYFDDEHPARLDPIGALAVEVWTMTEGIAFDNFWLGNDLKKAQEFAEQTWSPKHAAEVKENEEATNIFKANDDASLLDTIQIFIADLAAYAGLSSRLFIGSVGGLFVLLTGFYMCCASRKPIQTAVLKKEDSGAENDEGEDAKVPSSEDKAKTTRQRKKVPKVD
ncbi:hypothetical protein CCR75_003572 [Bremia lactucae]|uniref:Calnexin n=1 Tax=Bremia lactucae TaxID=4779 RepID=A0A976IDY4_BRELC|nr:hypothetical protein CCR75_003572 [Bremia lactucae]